jgi:hypothetical protein
LNFFSSFHRVTAGIEEIAGLASFRHALARVANMSPAVLPGRDVASV